MQTRRQSGLQGIKKEEHRFSARVAMLLLVGVGLVLILLALPLAKETHKDLFQLLALLITAVITLSSTPPLDVAGSTDSSSSRDDRIRPSPAFARRVYFRVSEFSFAYLAPVRSTVFLSSSRVSHRLARTSHGIVPREYIK